MEEKIITSRSNPLIKDIVKLSDKKHRDKDGNFCFEGRKLLEEALLSGVKLKAVLFTECAKNDSKVYQLLKKVEENTEKILISDEVYDKISYEKSPEGIFCVAETLDKLHNLCVIYEGSKSNSRELILDGIRDTGNLGTILRTASAFGIKNVILSSDCADVYNNKTVRASMGAVFRINTSRVSDLESTVKALRGNGKKVYSAALSKDAVNLTETSDIGKAVFIIGNEGSGIRSEIINASDGCVIIPMENGTESLNAASAATILLWEQYRQNT